MLKETAQLIAMAGEAFGANAPSVLLYAAASQTLHLPPDDAARLFEEARRAIAESGAADHINK